MSAAAANDPAPWAERAAWALTPVAVGLATLALCAVSLGNDPLSTDEAASLALADQPFRDVVHAAVHDDPGQGGYLLLLGLVSRIGIDEETIRIPSAIAVALAAMLLTLLGRRLLGRAGGIVAGLALGANAGVVDLAREARPHALGVLGVVAATLALAAAVQRDATWPWVVYALLAAALPLTHPLAAGVLLAHGAALAVRRQSIVHRRGGLAVAAGGAAAALLLAWMAADRLDAADGSGGLELTELADGGMRALGWSPVLLVAALAGLVALVTGRTTAPAAWKVALVVGLIAAPALVCVIAATAMPVYATAALVLCSPGIALAAGAAATFVHGRWLWAAAVALILASGIALVARGVTAPAEDWRSLAAAVGNVRGAHETIVVIPARSRAAFAYYAPDVAVASRARGAGAWVAVVADTPTEAIARARPAVHTPTYALRRQFRYGDGLRLQHWVRP